MHNLEDIDKPLHTKVGVIQERPGGTKQLYCGEVYNAYLLYIFNAKEPSFSSVQIEHLLAHMLLATVRQLLLAKRQT